MPGADEEHIRMDLAAIDSQSDAVGRIISPDSDDALAPEFYSSHVRAESQFLNDL